jgi:hypothetical protein
MGKTKGMINKNSIRKTLIKLSSFCDKCGTSIEGAHIEHTEKLVF